MPRRPMRLTRTPAEIIKSNGYPSEVHHAKTPDGYILQIDRIPRPGSPVVYLANQLFSSAAGYLILGKGKSLGFLLHDVGFDVWLGNFRGTNFSLTHETLSHKNDDFWQFGWHENALLDNPTMIDAILESTGQESLVYAGHSMGATTFLAMASERPDMRGKIRAAFLMAPTSFFGHHRNPQLDGAQPLVNVTQVLATMLRKHRQPVDTLRFALNAVCNNQIKAIRIVCHPLGLVPDNDSVIPAFAIFFPSGGSLGQILHYIQLGDRRWPGFRKYNYGAKRNRALYGTRSPPDYKLSHITTPVFMYNGRADKVCTYEDQLRLRNSLPNVRKFFFSPNRQVAHVDFALSDTAATDVFQYLIEDIKPYLKA